MRSRRSRGRRRTCRLRGRGSRADRPVPPRPRAVARSRPRRAPAADPRGPPRAGLVRPAVLDGARAHRVVPGPRSARRRSARTARRASTASARGRLDRLDLFLLVVLVVGALVLRTYRLAEPARMHFDEVYHARTATEFLQYWRYGISHDIYEWTHPHLAKYAMAGGIVASRATTWRPRATSACRSGMRRSSRAARTRPAPATAPATALWVATGDRARRLRPRDPGRRGPLGRCPAPARSPSTRPRSQLIVGTDDGRRSLRSTRPRSTGPRRRPRGPARSRRSR